MADDVKAEPDEVIDLTDDARIAKLQAENETLRARLEGEHDDAPTWRKIVAAILAVLAIITVLAAVEAVWLKTTLEDEDQFVSTFEPLPRDDAVAAALSTRIADGIIETREVEAFVSDLLPSEIGFLAAPITESIGRLMSEIASNVVQSDLATEAWSSALRVTHIAVSAVLSGNDRALESEGGVVSVNLDSIATVVVEQVEARGVDLPDLDVELGSVVILESDELAAAQSVAEFITLIGWFLPVLAIVFIALAIWASTDRRRMTAILGFGTAIALLFSLAALRFTESALLGDIEDQITRDAAEAAWDITLSRLIAGTWALLILALIVGLVAWLSGPSARAERIRSWGTSTVDGWRRPAEEEPSSYIAFLIEWKRTIQVVIVVLGLLFVLFGPTPSGWLVLGTAAVILALVVLVEVLAGPTALSEPETEHIDV